MSDTELFMKALEAVGGRKGDLARSAGVSRQTVSAWRTGQISDFARIKLKSVIERAT